MTSIHRRAWNLPEALVTPEHVFLNRRRFLAAAAAMPLLPPAGRAQEVPRLSYYPAAVNTKFQAAGRDITSEDDNTTFNNF